MAMERIDTTAALQALAHAERCAGRRIALVPTMGALHAGHVSLVKIARERADRVWLSIFVNPTQFDDPRDLAAYPRTLEADLAICRDAGVDAVFTPDAAQMYPAGAQTSVEVDELAAPLCGAARPGHFRGVATVVTKLLVAAQPHVAVFGEKDYQQLAVIRRLVRDLLLPVEIVGAPTVREPDGLALSSRNSYLDKSARASALALVESLRAAARAFAQGERRGDALTAEGASSIAAHPEVSVDYFAVVDAVAMQPVVDATPESVGIVAARVGKTRLIDNMVLGQPE